MSQFHHTIRIPETVLKKRLQETTPEAAVFQRDHSPSIFLLQALTGYQLQFPQISSIISGVIRASI